MSYYTYNYNITYIKINVHMALIIVRRTTKLIKGGHLGFQACRPRLHVIIFPFWEEIGGTVFLSKSKNVTFYFFRRFS